MLKYYKIWRGILRFSVLENLEVVTKLKWVYQARNTTPGRIFQLFWRIHQILDYQLKNQKTESKTIPSLDFVLKTKKATEKQEQRRKVGLEMAPPTFPLLVAEQYKVLKTEGLGYLETESRMPDAKKKSQSRCFIGHIIVVTLVTTASPRTQFFKSVERRHLQWISELETYEIRMDGHNPPLKNGKPIVLVLPKEVGKFWKIWLEDFRPRLFPKGEQVFVNTKGKKLTKISDLVKPITLKYLKIEVPASKFRYSIYFFWLT